MADLITDRLRYQLGLGFDWTAGNTFAVLIRKNTWTPAESDVFMADIFGAGALEASTADPGFGGADRQEITSAAVALSAGSAVWTGDGLAMPGIANGDHFDTLVLYNTVTGDADSWLMGVYALGAQTGDGNPITVNPAAAGYFQW